MIGRVYRGSRVGGLLRYLYGPGRHNEHHDPHLVAAWDQSDDRDLAALEPAKVGEAAFDVRPLQADLEAPLAYATRPPGQAVWHCPLRLADDDRRLTDEQWRAVAVDLMHRTGIAPRGDEGACRWVAIRHDDVSIHIVAVLARQDGRPVRLWRDYHRVREACLAAEQRYGLTATAPIDGTATPAATRGESEKAARLGRKEEARARLRREVRIAALAATDAPDFLARLRSAGLVVRERRGEAGHLTGYAVAVPGDTTAAGTPVYYGGGRLAPDLTLPRLQQRWMTPDIADRDGLAPGAAAAHVRREARLVGLLSTYSADEAGGAELLRTLAHQIEGPRGGALSEAAELLERGTRRPQHRRPPTGSLRRIARQIHAPQAKGRRDEGVLELITALAALATALAASRAATDASASVPIHRAAEKLEAWVVDRRLQVPIGALGGRSPRELARRLTVTRARPR